MKTLKLLFVMMLMAIPNTIEVSLQINPDLRACLAYDIHVAPNFLRTELEDEHNTN